MIGEKCWLAADVFVAEASQSRQHRRGCTKQCFKSLPQMWFAGGIHSGDTRTRKLNKFKNTEEYMSKVALITGVADGSYLAEFLLEKGYEAW